MVDLLIYYTKNNEKSRGAANISKILAARRGDPFQEECELIILSYYLLRRLVCWVEKIPRARWR